MEMDVNTKDNRLVASKLKFWLKLALQIKDLDV